MHRQLLLLLASLFLFGCNEPDTKSTETDVSNTEITLLLNWFPEAEHGGFYAAMIHGFYEDAGLRNFGGYEFWLRTTAKTPREAYPGQSWRFWQYSATGLIPGIAGEVDLNAFSGSAGAWRAWVSARGL